jgi:hypothetical protein
MSSRPPDPDLEAEPPTLRTGEAYTCPADPYDGIAGVEVADVITPHTPDEIRALLAGGYRCTFGVQIGAACLALATAMIILESGHGRWIHGQNFGNIGRGKFGGDYFPLRAREVIHGADRMVTQYERAHDSAEAGAADYWDYLHRNHPTALEAMRRGDVEGAAHALKLGFYYSALEHDYAVLWRALVEEGDRKWPR